MQAVLFLHGWTQGSAGVLLQHTSEIRWIFMAPWSCHISIRSGCLLRETKVRERLYKTFIYKAIYIRPIPHRGLHIYCIYKIRPALPEIDWKICRFKYEDSFVTGLDMMHRRPEEHSSAFCISHPRLRSGRTTRKTQVEKYTNIYWGMNTLWNK